MYIHMYRPHASVAALCLRFGVLCSNGSHGSRTEHHVLMRFSERDMKLSRLDIWTLAAFE